MTRERFLLAHPRASAGRCAHSVNQHERIDIAFIRPRFEIETVLEVVAYFSAREGCGTMERGDSTQPHPPALIVVVVVVVGPARRSCSSRIFV